MEKFAIQAQETIEVQEHLIIQEAGEELRRHEVASGTLVNFFESRLHNQFLDPHIKILLMGRSNTKDIDCKIKNRFCRIRHRDEIFSINKK